MAYHTSLSKHTSVGKMNTTDMALINIQDLITKAIDINTFSIGIFLDLAKAFDTVGHRILLKKLKYYRIRGISLFGLKAI